MNNIVVIDYGMGNLRSVAKAVEHAAPSDVRVRVSSDPKVIAEADRVVLPGQGAARDCMHEIDAFGLREVILDAAKNKPFLGICMGLQVLFAHSAESGGIDCLNILPGDVKAFASDLRDLQTGERLKVPAMGWNRVEHSEHALWAGIEQGAYFYFAHSYYVCPEQDDVAIAHSHYPTPFVCAVAQDNLMACQFHPEKSADDGLRLLANFIAWKG